MEEDIHRLRNLAKGFTGKQQRGFLGGGFFFRGLCGIVVAVAPFSMLILLLH